VTTLLLLFLAAAATGGLIWFGGVRDSSKAGLFVAHLLLGFAAVEGTAHLLRMSDLAYVEAIRSSSNIALLLVVAVLLSGFAAFSMRNKAAARFVHAGAGLGAILMILSISRQI
jgi:hypothetical protein